LPTEVLHNILRFLSGIELLAFLAASWPAFIATHSNAFWKSFLKHDQRSTRRRFACAMTGSSSQIRPWCVECPGQDLPRPPLLGA
jgi:hypothetical protein